MIIVTFTIAIGRVNVDGAAITMIGIVVVGIAVANEVGLGDVTAVGIGIWIEDVRTAAAVDRNGTIRCC